MNMVKLSIVTVNYNDKTGLGRTLASIREQTSRPYQFIVIDAASADGSVEILRANLDVVDDWVSEPDAGPYEGMNKGFDRVKGDYVLFLNSGDTLFSSDIVDTIAQSDLGADVHYSNASFSRGGKSWLHSYPETIDLEYLFFNTLNHQNMLIKTSVLREHGGYDTGYKVLADWAFIMDLVSQNGSLRHFGHVIATYNLEGLSGSKKGGEQSILDRVRYYENSSFAFSRILSEYTRLTATPYHKIKERFGYVSAIEGINNCMLYACRLLAKLGLLKKKHGSR